MVNEIWDDERDSAFTAKVFLAHLPRSNFLCDNYKKPWYRTHSMAVGSVFLGVELGRSKKWLRVTSGYAGIVAKAFEDFQGWPSQTRESLPSEMPGESQLLRPVIMTRRKERKYAIARGVPPPEYNDALDWSEMESNGAAYDPEIGHLSLSLATDLLTQTFTEAEIVEFPRDHEAMTIKESQRMKTWSRTGVPASLGRMTMEETTVLPKGCIIIADASEMEFRDKQKFAELTTTPPEHLAFGHGMYACPGRFFTANEVQITLIGNLMKYEIEPEDVVLLTNSRYRIIIRS
ncbi:hypothetical protein EV127DRAFT_410433 [Xylaria flabelliformis]|nr:hypothetical protein EV127DRAFT_410433 [Xylaria flabelliformis]